MPIICKRCRDAGQDTDIALAAHARHAQMAHGDDPADEEDDADSE
jgi:hypothetical protein